jgi:hypothetical protein
MKLLPFMLLILLVTGCARKRRDIEFSGTVTGVKSGTAIVKDESDSTFYGVNIKNGYFSFSGPFDSPGYYKLAIHADGKTDSIAPYEIYLEAGKYKLETAAWRLANYPKIASPSKIQEQLSTFYTLYNKADSEAMSEEKRTREVINQQINEQIRQLRAGAITKLLVKASSANAQKPTSAFIAFKQFVTQNPGNDIGIHLMDKLNYTINPAGFYLVFKMLSPTLRNSERGRYIDSVLSRMVKVVPGAIAPVLYGKSPDGAAFDTASIKKKYILVDFWRSNNSMGRDNHQKLLKVLNNPAYGKKFTIVSVSMDSNRDAWLKAIKEDSMTWPQLSDLEANKSPNFTNWMIQQYPCYYLLDSHWHIIKSNILGTDIDNETECYLNSLP